jgi:transcriptional regulator with XRE-family HTH domain
MTWSEGREDKGRPARVRLLRPPNSPSVNESAVAALRREGGRWLKHLREAQNLSQRGLAAKIGLEYYTFISQLESGRGRIPPDRYRVWAQALGVDLREFVRELLRYYDPVTYKILFAKSGTEQVPGVVRSFGPRADEFPIKRTL